MFALMSLIMQEVAALKGQLHPTWEIVDDGKTLERRFACKNFVKALDALNKYGAVAERMGHHPDLSVYGYKNVCIRYVSSGSKLPELDAPRCRGYGHPRFIVVIAAGFLHTRPANSPSMI